MPNIVNPEGLSKSPSLLSAVRSAILVYATEILNNESPVIAPNAGWKYSQKRIALAQQVLSNPDTFVEKATFFLATIHPSIVIDNQDNFRYLVMDNPMSQNFCVAEVTYGSYNSAKQGRSIWDNLAGVSQVDLQ
jgi:hypothetical protein